LIPRKEQTMQKKLTTVERYGHRAGESPDEIKKRATGFVARFISKGGRLVIGFAGDHAGHLILTLAVGVGGDYLRSPSLDGLALGLGVVTALQFVEAFSRYRNQAGSIAVEPGEIAEWEKTGEPRLHSGTWTGSEDDWLPSSSSHWPDEHGR
jgi:hypothetical protein